MIFEFWIFNFWVFFRFQLFLDLLYGMVLPHSTRIESQASQLQSDQFYISRISIACSLHLTYAERIAISSNILAANLLLPLVCHQLARTCQMPFSVFWILFWNFVGRFYQIIKSHCEPPPLHPPRRRHFQRVWVLILKRTICIEHFLWSCSILSSDFFSAVKVVRLMGS